MWIDSNIVGNCHNILGCTNPSACNYDIFANTNPDTAGVDIEGYEDENFPCWWPSLDCDCVTIPMKTEDKRVNT